MGHKLLVEINKLNILNDGYQRKIFFDKIYLNPSHIISISAHSKIKDFLLNESPDSSYAKSEYSLLKVSSGASVEEIIARGTPEFIFSLMREKKQGKVILND